MLLKEVYGTSNLPTDTDLCKLVFRSELPEIKENMYNNMQNDTL